DHRSSTVSGLPYDLPAHAQDPAALPVH
ncbi:MAG: hypothetical protein K0R58_4326, partial [Ramlibacter sp.]|nr:hypothetical protein [Ramlibacter sp.]